MKKLFFIAALAGVALASCVKNEVAPTAMQQNEITFAAPVVGTPTKVDLITTFPTANTFGVFGYYYVANFNGFTAGELYMDNVQVSHVANVGGDTDGGWVADGYYWPKQKDATLTFAAYYPYMATGVSHDVTGIHFTDYEVEATASEDLLFSDRSYNNKKADQSANNDTYYGVNITFQHALSAILFKAKAATGLTGNADKPNYTFVIKKIEVVDAQNKGSFNQSILDATDGTTPATPPASTSDWTISATSAKTTYTAYESTTGITVNSTTAVSANGSSDGVDDGKADLILLPQNLAGVKVRVTYDMRHDKMVGGEYVTGNVAEANLSYDDVDNTKDVTSWLRGKRYIYTLVLDLDKIYFAPNMTDWVDVTVAGEPSVI